MSLFCSCLQRHLCGIVMQANEQLSFFIWRSGERPSRSTSEDRPRERAPEPNNDAQANPVANALESGGPYFGKQERELAHGEMMLSNSISTHSSTLRGHGEPAERDKLLNTSETRWGLGGTTSNPFFAGSDFSTLIDSQDSFMRGRQTGNDSN